MKSLILVRHAKSDWNLHLDDKKRPLTDNGKMTINKVGQIAKDFIDDEFVIWCSNAVRTTETVIIF